MDELVGTALELVCPSKDRTRPESFRIMMGILDEKGTYSYFKQQMCMKSDSIMKVFKEVEGYESLAKKMGMKATVITVLRST